MPRLSLALKRSILHHRNNGKSAAQITEQLSIEYDAQFSLQATFSCVTGVLNSYKESQDLDV